MKADNIGPFRQLAASTIVGRLIADTVKVALTARVHFFSIRPFTRKESARAGSHTTGRWPVLFEN